MAALTRAAFDRYTVGAAANPSPEYGYHHGPIPNNNHGWHPPRQAAAIASKARPPSVTSAENGQAPNTPAVMSAVNGGVCMIDMGAGVMCGVQTADQPALRRHMRDFHSGAVANPTRRGVTPAEAFAGQNALKKFVLTRAWRDAQFVREPGRGPRGGLLDRYATALEDIAAADAAFAHQFGARFHRDGASHIHTTL